MRSLLLWINSLTPVSPISLQCQVQQHSLTPPRFLPDHDLGPAPLLLDPGWKCEVVEKPGGSIQANLGFLFIFAIWQIQTLGQGQYLLTISALFLKKQSSAAATLAATKPSVQLTPNTDLILGTKMTAMMASVFILSSRRISACQSRLGLLQMVVGHMPRSNEVTWALLAIEEKHLSLPGSCQWPGTTRICQACFRGRRPAKY